ncbi:MAG: L-fuconate dehydratase [Alphaproteobacteria bacterium]
MTLRITNAEISDIRFPTSKALDGSDAMNPDPDYSAAYVVLHTSQPGLQGHGFTFTTGRGTEICTAAIAALAPLVEGRALAEFTNDMGAFWRHITGDSQLRWIGPEKGAIHLATAAIVNAVWDLWAKTQGKPLWRLVADMSPEEFVRAIDFRYLTDALTPQDALEILKALAPGKDQRIADMEQNGYPAYTTSAGWLGYGDEKLRALTRQAVAAGWTHIKLKVGHDLDDDIRRLEIVRQEIGPNRKLMIDANQVWDVPTAIEWLGALKKFDPWWIEEPTSPDDILGHGAIARATGLKIATGEHCQNRVMFKQFMQAGAMDFCQIDACRLGGVNEVLAVLLLAAKHNIPVCPHAGGVGLCEHVQHLSMIDYVCVSGKVEGRVIEYIDHLHEHFADPCRVANSHYLAPRNPGYSTQIKLASRSRYAFPSGPVWRAS